MKVIIEIEIQEKIGRGDGGYRNCLANSSPLQVTMGMFSKVCGWIQPLDRKSSQFKKNLLSSKEKL